MCTCKESYIPHLDWASGPRIKLCEYCKMKNTIASLEAERDKLKESISHFSGLLGEETQKRYALEAERDTASHNAEHYANLCIKAEAERDKAVELLRGLIRYCTHCETYRMLGYLSHCEKCQDVQSFLASVGGEES